MNQSTTPQATRQVLIGTLVAGTLDPVGIGTRNTHRAIVVTNRGHARAYLKPLERPSIIAECFAALLLQEWGLVVPQPMIVTDGSVEYFGSEAMSYPDLKRRYQLGQHRMPEHLRLTLQSAAIAQLCSFPDTPLALAADEAIGNGDRNLENVLWDGESRAWIDHERAFGLPGSRDGNKLADIAVAVPSATERVERSAIALALTFAQPTVNEVCAQMPAPADAQTFAAYVAGRLPGLAQRVSERFPHPKDLLG